MLETARIIGEAAQRGSRPRRSIAIASWDAEEWGLIGSVEYGEEFGSSLQGNLIAYLNRESYTAGSFGAAGVHSLQPFINELVRSVRMPDDQQSVWEHWAGLGPEERIIDHDGEKNVRIGALGSGSDFTVFLDHLGIPSVNVGFSSGNGVYHSRYDSQWFYRNFGDAEFTYGERLAELSAFFLLRVANADVLPFDYGSLAETIDRYLDELEEEAMAAGLDLGDDLDMLRRHNRNFGATAIALSAEIGRLLGRLDHPMALNLSEERIAENQQRIRDLNDMLLGTEQAFLTRRGLPGRPWFRHQVYAPGFYTGYGVKTLPGVREAIEKGDAAEAHEMVGRLAGALEGARRVLVHALMQAAEINSTIWSDA